jgi:hypothetical protein
LTKASLMVLKPHSTTTSRPPIYRLYTHQPNANIQTVHTSTRQYTDCTHINRCHTAPSPTDRPFTGCTHINPPIYRLYTHQPANIQAVHTSTRQYTDCTHINRPPIHTVHTSTRQYRTDCTHINPPISYRLYTHQPANIQTVHTSTCQYHTDCTHINP